MRQREKARPSPRGGKAPTKSGGFTDDEREAMQERAGELRAESGRSARGGRTDGERDLLAKIAEMPEPDRDLATRIHAIVTSAAPALSPKTWYGMPAYARDGKVFCFDQGAMWPTAFALKELTSAAESTIAALVKRAVS